MVSIQDLKMTEEKHLQLKQIVGKLYSQTTLFKVILHYNEPFNGSHPLALVWLCKQQSFREQ